MKKSLLAMAVLASFAGAAQAQSNVTIYGLVDMALQRQDLGEAAGPTTALDSGIQSGSRLGFKGSEDLGGGLKANFQLEMGINIDEGRSAQGGRAFGRQAWVGLSGDFGSVSMGRQYTPSFIAIDNVDPFGTGLTSGTAGSGTSTFGAASFFHGTGRVNNSVSYSSNSMGGFSANAFYGLGEVAGNMAAGRFMDLSGAYTDGPLFATLAYTSEQNAAGNDATKKLFLAGTYNFGMMTAHGAFSTIKNDTSTLDVRVWMLGASIPVGAGSIIADYISHDVRNSANANAKHIAFGYTYALSKRTNLYSSISRTANDAGSNIGSDDSGPGFHPVAGGASVKMFNLGIRHKF